MHKLASLETGRLRLRLRRRDDLDALMKMELDPEVYRYSDLRSNFDRRVPNPVELRKRLRAEIRSGSPRDFWVIEWKEQPTFLGLAGLYSQRPGVIGLPYQEGTNFLMYRLARSAWGQGIATEAAYAILDYGFRVLMCPTIAAFSHKDNRASSRILDKIGMDQCGDIKVPYQSNLIASKVFSPVDIYLFYQLDRAKYTSRVGKINTG
jgi:RimJ/RimL family protein N-acetyltransferase